MTRKEKAIPSAEEMKENAAANGSPPPVNGKVSEKLSAAFKEAGEGRKSKENGTAALRKLDEDIRAAEELYGDGMPCGIERLENQIRFFQNQAGAALLEMVRALIRIKAHEGHGSFLQSLERLGIAHRSAVCAMTAVRKFSNMPTLAYLGDSKTKNLSVLDKEDIGKPGKGGDVNGLTPGGAGRMTCAGLRKTLREIKEENGAAEVSAGGGDSAEGGKDKRTRPAVALPAVSGRGATGNRGVVQA